MACMRTLQSQQAGLLTASGLEICTFLRQRLNCKTSLLVTLSFPSPQTKSRGFICQQMDQNLALEHRTKDLPTSTSPTVKHRLLQFNWARSSWPVAEY